MNTIILPGFSLKNKDWAEKIKLEIESTFLVTIHSWKHWNTGSAQPGWTNDEFNSILKSLPNEKVNIIAKSIGTLVACLIAKSNAVKINKLILCGIPVNDISENDKDTYQNLKNLSVDKILCIQNEKDPHGSLEDINILLSKINRNIKIVSKPRADHEYPYADEFINFLK